MAETSQNIIQKAETRFLETQKKTAERNKAMAEYQSEAKARAIKTAKLRELRLAKEEEDRAAVQAANDAKPKRKAKAVKAAKPVDFGHANAAPFAIQLKTRLSAGRSERFQLAGAVRRSTGVAPRWRLAANRLDRLQHFRGVARHLHRAQILAILPSRSIRKVVRSTPIYLRPYMLFSAQTP